VFFELGGRKIRLTGGEPLLRAELHRLVRLLAGIGDFEIALTTNGSLLARHAAALADAGLNRVTVSLDALEPDIFRANADADYDVADVLGGIEAAARAGLSPIKINTVVRRGINDGEVLALARHFRGTGHVLRFIEYMDVGVTNGWQLREVVSAREIVERIASVFPLEPLEPTRVGEVAQRYRYQDGAGEIGVISSVTAPFCGACTRLRLSSEGRLYTCLFALGGHDVRALLRNGADDAQLATFVRDVWTRREDRYSETRSEATRPLRRIEMSYIGG
jgi:cyclic pyranopterin phosphate synthase